LSVGDIAVSLGRSLFARARIFAIAGAAISLLASCSSTPLFVKKPKAPTTLQEGVSVTGTVVYVRPWSEVKDALSPKFENTPANALSQVLQTQSYSDFRLLNALGLSAQAGVDLGPRITRTDESTRHLDTSGSGDTFETTRDENTQTITTKRVDDNTPPDLPAAPASSAGTRTAASLPDLIGATRTPTSEPMFRYAAAAALYQEIGLINDAVLGIPELEGYKPYIVRIRMGVNPFRRDLPWDVYAHISLFEEEVAKPGDNAATGDRDRSVAETVPEPIIILPILSTEAYEGTLDAAALQQLFDLRLALQATAGNAKAGAGFNKLNENLTTFLTRRYESSLRVSAASGRGIDVKFGASRDKTGFALSDRDHFVTLIAYIKPPYQDENAKKLTFYMMHEARDAKTGAIIAVDNDAFYSALVPVMQRLGLTDDQLNSDCEIHHVDELLYRFADEVTRLSASTAATNLNRCLKIPIQHTDYLIAELSAIRRLDPKSLFSFSIAPIKHSRSAEFLDASPYVQSSKKSLTVAVPYTGELEIDAVRALLVPDGIAQAGPFAPRTVTLRTSGSQNQVVLEFPSLVSLKFDGLSDKEAEKLKSPAGWRICAAVSATALGTCRTGAAASGKDAYSRRLSSGYAETPAVDAPAFVLSTPVQSVKIGADGLVTFAVYVEPAKDRPVTLTTEGAELMVGGAAANELEVKAKGAQSLTLRNALAGGTIRIHAVSTAEADTSVKTEHEVIVAVQAPAAPKT
jgi:hypothetical protein